MDTLHTPGSAHYSYPRWSTAQKLSQCNPVQVQDPRAALLAAATKVKPMVGLMTLTGLTAARSTAPNYCTSTCSRVLTDVKLGPMIQRTRCKVFFFFFAFPKYKWQEHYTSTPAGIQIHQILGDRCMDGWMHLRFVTEDRESLLKGPDLKQGKIKGRLPETHKLLLQFCKWDGRMQTVSTDWHQLCTFSAVSTSCRKVQIRCSCTM
jgi:hypothetical protein